MMVLSIMVAVSMWCHTMYMCRDTITLLSISAACCVGSVEVL